MQARSDTVRFGSAEASLVRRARRGAAARTSGLAGFWHHVGAPTARAYRTEAEVFPSMGPDLMLDVGWQAVADRIDTWIRETAL